MTIQLIFYHHPYFDTNGETSISMDKINVKMDGKIVEEDDGYGGKIPKTFTSVTEVYKWLMSNVGITLEETHRYG